MNRRLGALIAAVLLTGVLAGPAEAAKPALNVSVAKASASCSITVNVSWARPNRGQGLLTIYLEDTRTSFRPYVQFAVSPTATSGSATFVIGSNTDGYSDSLTGWAYLNRDFDSTRFSYDLLLTGSSTALVTPDCILTHS